jgi:hypothetical protein
MNTNFSSPEFKSNSNFYTLEWNNHSNFSWQAQVIGNYALQFDKLQNLEYSQFDNQASHPSAYNYPTQELSLEDTLKVFMQSTDQVIQELRSVIQVNTQATTGLEDWIGQSENEYPAKHQLDPITQYWGNENIEDNNEEEELQTQLMAKIHYMIDEADSSNSYHKHIQANTTLESEEIVEGTCNEPSLEDPLGECFAKFGCDLDLDKLLEQANTFSEPSLEDLLE